MNKRKNGGTVLAGVTMAGVVAGVALVTSLAGAGPSLKISAPLVATSAAPRAVGRAQVALKGTSTGKLEVVARRLAPDTTFDVVLGGVKVAQLNTSGSGRGKVRLRSRPHGHDRLLGFDPRGNDIVVRDHGTAHGSSTHDPHPCDHEPPRLGRVRPLQLRQHEWPRDPAASDRGHAPPRRYDEITGDSGRALTRGSSDEIAARPLLPAGHLIPPVREAHVDVVHVRGARL